MHPQPRTRSQDRMPAADEGVLVVDDNQLNLKLMRVLLAKEGYQVRLASSAREAIDVLDTFQPRLILMDLQMPDIDGLELTRRLKANPRTSRLVIVAVTAYAMTGARETALAAGCDGYITKPIDARTLPGVLRTYIDAAH